MKKITIPHFVAIEIQQAKQMGQSSIEVLVSIYEVSNKNKELKEWLRTSGNLMKISIAIEKDYDVEYMDSSEVMKKLEEGCICCCANEDENVYYRMNKQKEVYEYWDEEKEEHLNNWQEVDNISFKEIKTGWYVVPKQYAERVLNHGRS
ncbi:hypothetical protein [Bacillus sp. NPDC094106]|uniref:hypothetical protein n=1 Tax=Bacillus sp. NPDC094106 TaxID=3363949 RepID=UPI0037F39171